MYGLFENQTTGSLCFLWLLKHFPVCSQQILLIHLLVCFPPHLSRDSVRGEVMLLIQFKTLLWQPAGAFAGKLSHCELLWSRCDGWWNLSLSACVSLSSSHRLFEASKAENANLLLACPPFFPLKEKGQSVCAAAEERLLATAGKPRCFSRRLLGYWTVKR